MAVLLSTVFLTAFFGAISGNLTNACTGVRCFLPQDYDRKARPTGSDDKPLEIQLKMLVESFGNVNVANMEFNVFGYLSQNWIDPRLSNVSRKSLILEGEDASQIWLPDLYCINCRESNLENGRNPKQGMTRIDRNGEVSLSFLFVCTATCKMDLREFPFDTQQCSLEFSSYAYNSSLVSYQWAKRPVVKLKSMDQFLIMNERSSTRSELYMLGNFTIPVASFTFKRRVGFYILQLYIPTAMLVCLSWSMFFLNRVHSGERITIGVTLFLTMIFLNGYANTSLPRVSYIKSVDTFMVVSLAEILFITFESIVATKLLAKRDWKTQPRKRSKKYSINVNEIANRFHSTEKEMELKSCLEDKTEIESSINEIDSEYSNCVPTLVGTTDDAMPSLVQSKGHQNGIRLTRKSRRCNKNMVNIDLQGIIEKTSRVVFPASYLAFNAWYWLRYLHESTQNSSTAFLFQ